MANSVPLGQAGTGSAFILGENKALNRYLENQDYNAQVDRQNALLREKQKQASDKALSDSWTKNALKSQSGLIFQDLDKQSKDYMTQAKELYTKGIDPYSPYNGDDPEIAKKVEDLQNQRTELEMSYDKRKALQPAYLAEINKVDPNKYTPESITELMNYGSLPMKEALAKGIPQLQEKFNRATFVDKIDIGTTKTKTDANGRIIEQTTTDPTTVRNAVVNGLKGNPAIKSTLINDLGIPEQYADVNLLESLPDTPEKMQTTVISEYKGNPTFREEMATKYGITSVDDPKFTALVQQTGAQNLQYKKRYNEYIGGLQKDIIAKNPSSYSNTRNLQQERFNRQLAKDAEKDNGTEEYKVVENFPYYSGVQEKTGKDQVASKVATKAVQVNVPGEITLNPVERVWSVQQGKMVKFPGGNVNISAINWTPTKNGHEKLVTVVDKDGRNYLVPNTAIPISSKNTKQYKKAESTLGNAPSSSKSTGKQAVGGYKIGQIESGYKYLGGDPSKQENWKKQ